MKDAPSSGEYWGKQSGAGERERAGEGRRHDGRRIGLLPGGRAEGARYGADRRIRLNGACRPISGRADRGGHHADDHQQAEQAEENERGPALSRRAGRAFGRCFGHGSHTELREAVTLALARHPSAGAPDLSTILTERESAAKRHPACGWDARPPHPRPPHPQPFSQREKGVPPLGEGSGVRGTLAHRVLPDQSTAGEGHGVRGDGQW